MIGNDAYYEKEIKELKEKVDSLDLTNAMLLVRINDLEEKVKFLENWYESTQENLKRNLALYGYKKKS